MARVNSHRGKMQLEFVPFVTLLAFRKMRPDSSILCAFILLLKGQCYEILGLDFFHQSTPSSTLMNGLEPQTSHNIDCFLGSLCYIRTVFHLNCLTAQLSYKGRAAVEGAK
jgi:hypothetical protein